MLISFPALVSDSLARKLKKYDFGGMKNKRMAIPSNTMARTKNDFLKKGNKRTSTPRRI